jgi:hypothetical protein
LLFNEINFIILESFVESRGGGGGGGRGGGGGGSRGGGGVRASSSRFSYSRSTGYRYGTYSGARYGTSIRRTTYWPIYRIGYGYPYYYGYHNSYNYYNQRPNTVISTSNVSSDIVISDSYTKSVNISDISYNCVDNKGSIVASCYEPINNIENSTLNNLIPDGCCCENTTSRLAVCCIVELNSNLNKANKLL